MKVVIHDLGKTSTDSYRPHTLRRALLFFLLKLVIRQKTLTIAMITHYSTAKQRSQRGAVAQRRAMCQLHLRSVNLARRPPKRPYQRAVFMAFDAISPQIDDDSFCSIHYCDFYQPTQVTTLITEVKIPLVLPSRLSSEERRYLVCLEPE